MMRFKTIWLLLLTVFCLVGCSEKEIPVEEGYLTLNGSEVYYKTMGSGEPLVIVHGGPVLDHSYFLPHFESLARDYQLIFYDQRACGRSSVAVDSATMSLNGFVEDIEQLRLQLGLGKINLLGHSWGGLLAMKYAIKYDDNLERLVLSNSMAPSVADWQAENIEVAKKTNPKDQKRLDAIVSSGLLRTEDPTEYIREMLMLSYKIQMYDTAKLEQLELYVPQDFMVRSQVFGLLGPDMGTFDLYNDLQKVSTPTLVIYGESEPAVDLHAQKLVGALKNGRLEVIKESGHFPFIESTSAFNQLVRSF